MGQHEMAIAQPMVVCSVGDSGRGLFNADQSEWTVRSSSRAYFRQGIDRMSHFAELHLA